jgi:hypothetical protein
MLVGRGWVGVWEKGQAGMRRRVEGGLAGEGEGAGTP